jgi:hypothetical protein
MKEPGEPVQEKRFAGPQNDPGLIEGGKRRAVMRLYHPRLNYAGMIAGYFKKCPLMKGY